MEPTDVNYENEHGALEPIRYMSRQRLKFVAGWLAVNDIDNSRMIERDAVAGEIARRAAYQADIMPTLAAAGYMMLGTSAKYACYKDGEPVTIPSVRRQETLEDAWAEVIRYTPAYRDPLEIPPAP